MGMGSYAVNSFVIGYDDLKKIVPEEIKTIENGKYFDCVGWAVMGKWLGWDDNYQIIDALHDAVLDDKSKPVMRLELTEEKIVEDIFEQYEQFVGNLKDVFHQKTGLTLYFDCYDEDVGDRYDEPNDKDGCIFCVDGMMQLTPAGEKYKNIVTERRWTQFG